MKSEPQPKKDVIQQEMERIWEERDQAQGSLRGWKDVRGLLLFFAVLFVSFVPLGVAAEFARKHKSELPTWMIVAGCLLAPVGAILVGLCFKQTRSLRDKRRRK